MRSLPLTMLRWAAAPQAQVALRCGIPFAEKASYCCVVTCLLRWQAACQAYDCTEHLLCFVLRHHEQSFFLWMKAGRQP